MPSRETQFRKHGFKALGTFPKEELWSPVGRKQAPAQGAEDSLNLTHATSPSRRTVEYDKSLLAKYLHRGDKVNVCIAHQSERPAAERYIAEHSKGFPEADVKIIVGKPGARSGRLAEGRRELVLSRAT